MLLVAAGTCAGILIVSAAPARSAIAASQDDTAEQPWPTPPEAKIFSLDSAWNPVPLRIPSVRSTPGKTSGRVIIEMEVGTSGTVTAARMVEGPHALQGVSMAVVKGCRFVPPHDGTGSPRTARARAEFEYIPGAKSPFELADTGIITWLSAAGRPEYRTRFYEHTAAELEHVRNEPHFPANVRSMAAHSVRALDEGEHLLVAKAPVDAAPHPAPPPFVEIGADGPFPVEVFDPHPPFPGTASCKIALEVDTGGLVSRASVESSSEPIYAREALAAALLWRFRPFRVSGVPTAFVRHVTFEARTASAVAGAKSLHETRIHPHPLIQTPPDYPAGVKPSIASKVVLEITVDPSGKVVAAIPVHGDPPFTEAAVTAARSWRYRPLVLNGKAIAWTDRVTLTFQPRTAPAPGMPTR